MITFFNHGRGLFTAVETDAPLDKDALERLAWLMSGAKPMKARSLRGRFVGPRREMLTPWSTNAAEIAANAGVAGIRRMEQFRRVPADAEPKFDPMLQSVYDGLGQRTFLIDRKPDPVVHISDIAAYNDSEGLALSADEVAYLQGLSEKLGRPLTDSEVFGFSQVNSEHCRHKIFNGRFVIDGNEMPQSLFAMIKQTSKENPGGLVSAYKDNVAFVKGPQVDMFYPENPSEPDFFTIKPVPTVLSLKAETHNFPTTVEPFNGAATGSGGEIRDRLGGGRASLPLAGTAVYMTSYPRIDPETRPWELMTDPRVWLYRSPADILIKASNGASDFGNKFGQPLICGSVLTFEHDEQGRLYAYDKVIMLAGGVGFALEKDAIKGVPEPGQAVVVMGGDNYRIGMGGGAVSSVDTGRYAGAIELNAVQRANPEMQKRVSNVIRALAESPDNPIVSIHDHGAGGHLNALSELVEATGGHISLDALPVGDPTLSDKEIVGNESQERMGLVLRRDDLERVRRIALRENAPMFVVGETTDDHRFVFSRTDGSKPIDLEMTDMFGNPPKTVITDTTVNHTYSAPEVSDESLMANLEAVLSLEAVACKDWLTNKVDRSVTGRVARQQCKGPLQLPLSDCGVMALDYTGRHGIATSIGHAPQVALASAEAGSELAIAEALTNIVGAPLTDGLKSISLSANWMWPCKNPGEDAALYRAVQACSRLACALGINIPTGKDSLSMTQQYGDRKVLAPGTVIISAAGETDNVRLTVSPVLQPGASELFYIDFTGSERFPLGGSALYQTLGRVGSDVPRIDNPDYFAAAFNAVQTLVKQGTLLAAHDVSAGGLIIALLEMTFANTAGGIDLDLDLLGTPDDSLSALLFSEKPALVVQVKRAGAKTLQKVMAQAGVACLSIGRTSPQRLLTVTRSDRSIILPIDSLRRTWYRPSYLLDRLQSGERQAEARFRNFERQPVRWTFPEGWNPSLASRALDLSRTERTGIRAAIIREKGVNGDREMAYSLYLAGFDVKDVHMTDLISGRESLDDVRMIVFCGGFSNSDVLGSAKGWAGSFRFNEKARRALERFYARKDTMSLGICNGCQLMIELGLINPDHERPTRMDHNVSHKFESNFISLTIPESPSIMLKPLMGTRPGIWVAHGEGRFVMPMPREHYCVAATYTHAGYPGNPNGSPRGVAALCSPDGRHLAMMPHLERAIFPWQCGTYPAMTDDITPWLDAFIAARRWLAEN